MSKTPRRVVAGHETCTRHGRDFNTCRPNHGMPAREYAPTIVKKALNAADSAIDVSRAMGSGGFEPRSIPGNASAPTELATMSGPLTPALTSCSTLFETRPQRPLTTAEAAGLIVYQNRVDWQGAFTGHYRGRWPVTRVTTR